MFGSQPASAPLDGVSHGRHLFTRPLPSLRDLAHCVDRFARAVGGLVHTCIVKPAPILQRTLIIQAKEIRRANSPVGLPD